jgi:hypothetical protein
MLSQPRHRSQAYGKGQAEFANDCQKSGGGSSQRRDSLGLDRFQGFLPILHTGNAERRCRPKASATLNAGLGVSGRFGVRVVGPLRFRRLLCTTNESLLDANDTTSLATPICNSATILRKLMRHNDKTSNSINGEQRAKECCSYSRKLE